MKVLVTGSREWADAAMIRAALEQVGASVVVHGDYEHGADRLADTVAKAMGLEVHPYPADWRRYGPSAGPRRNQQMLDSEHVAGDPIRLVLAFPTRRSRGTWDMCDRADRVGIEVRVCGDTGIKKRDTPENRAFWLSVERAADHWRDTMPMWAKQAVAKDSEAR